MTTHIARLVVQSFQKPVAAPAPPANPAGAPAAVPSAEISELSDREQQVLDLLAQGLIYKEIADKLNIGYETVHTYIRRIYEKLQVRTRTEAVAKFLQR
jgi:DNA-binding CsgD family transcriptional regulator